MEQIPFAETQDNASSSMSSEVRSIETSRREESEIKEGGNKRKKKKRG